MTVPVRVMSALSMPTLHVAVRRQAYATAPKLSTTRDARRGGSSASGQPRTHLVSNLGAQRRGLGVVAAAAATAALALGRGAGNHASSSSGSGGESRRRLSTKYRQMLQAQRQPESSEHGFVDTHCHLNMILPRWAKEKKADAFKAAQKAEREGGTVLEAEKELGRVNARFEDWRASLEGPETGFQGCVNVGCSTRGIDESAEFLEHRGVYGAFGIHPLNAGEWSDEVEEKLIGLMDLPKTVAWGECGLDYFDKQTKDVSKNRKMMDLQIRVFKRQLQLASDLNKPLVVHTRMAEEDTLALMKEHLDPSHKVHVHCFTSSAGLATELLTHFKELCIGFTGVITFKNAPEVQEVVRDIPIDRILLETDGPYMAPVPFRGRIAHPGHVVKVGEKVAELKDLPVADVFKACRENTYRTYGF